MEKHQASVGWAELFWPTITLAMTASALLRVGTSRMCPPYLALQTWLPVHFTLTFELASKN